MGDDRECKYTEKEGLTVQESSLGIVVYGATSESQKTKNDGVGRGSSHGPHRRRFSSPP